MNIDPGCLHEQAAQINFDIDVRQLRQELLAEFARANLRIEVVVSALAEIVGIAAAQLDEKEGVQSIADRLHEFCERAETLYQRRRANPNILALSFK
jgi:hypothetical protein